MRKRDIKLEKGKLELKERFKLIFGKALEKPILFKTMEKTKVIRIDGFGSKYLLYVRYFDSLTKNIKWKTINWKTPTKAKI